MVIFLSGSLNNYFILYFLSLLLGLCFICLFYLFFQENLWDYFLYYFLPLLPLLLLFLAVYASHLYFKSYWPQHFHDPLYLIPYIFWELLNGLGSLGNFYFDFVHQFKIWSKSYYLGSILVNMIGYFMRPPLFFVRTVWKISFTYLISNVYHHCYKQLHIHQDAIWMHIPWSVFNYA